MRMPLRIGLITVMLTLTAPIGAIADEPVPPLGNLLGGVGGNLLGEDGGNLLGEDGGNLLGEDGGNLLAEEAGNLLGDDAGNLLEEHAGGPWGDAWREVEAAPDNAVVVVQQVRDIVWPRR